MRRVQTELKHIQYNSPISDVAFVKQLQHALLLALREQGTLTFMQYRQAEELLNQQHRKQLRERGEF